MKTIRLNCMLALCLCSFGCERTTESPVIEPKSDVDYERRMLELERDERQLKAQIEKTENENALKQSDFKQWPA